MENSEKVKYILLSVIGTIVILYLFGFISFNTHNKDIDSLEAENEELKRQISIYEDEKNIKEDLKEIKDKLDETFSEVDAIYEEIVPNEEHELYLSD